MTRSYWTSPDTWCDPDCIECDGEGAPCCDPPDDPLPARIYPPCAQLVHRQPGSWIPVTDAPADSPPPPRTEPE